MDDILAGPGALTGQSNGDGNLPDDSGPLNFLTTGIGNLIPVPGGGDNSMDSLVGGMLGSGSGYYGGGSYGSASAYNAATGSGSGYSSSGLGGALSGILGTTSAGSSNPLGGLGSVLTPLLQTGLSAVTGLVIQPATYQAQLAQQQQSLANQEQAAATSSAINTNSITTILFWAAIAWGIVLLFEGFSKKV